MLTCKDEMGGAESPQCVWLKRGTGRTPGAYLPYLRAWRQRSGWTQGDLGAHAQVTASTISRLERQTMPASLLLVERLSNVLGIESCMLIDRAPYPNEDVVPPMRVMVKERLRQDGQPGTELLFYTVMSWQSVERAEARGLTRAAIAGTLGLTLDQLTAVIEAEEPLPMTTVEHLARILDTSLLNLLDWEGWVHHGVPAYA